MKELVVVIYFHNVDARKSIPYIQKDCVSPATFHIASLLLVHAGTWVLVACVRRCIH